MFWQNDTVPSDLVDLVGARLRSLRTAQGRTLAQVAVDAALSVPYVANLESGRGNPTLSALEALASALGTTVSELTDHGLEPTSSPLPIGLEQFARSARLKDETRRLSIENGSETSDTRHRLVAAMAAVGAHAPRRLEQLDWHRVLDALVILYRRAPRR